MRYARPPAHPPEQRTLPVAGQSRFRPGEEGLMNVMAGNSGADGVDMGGSGDGLDLHSVAAGATASALLRA